MKFSRLLSLASLLACVSALPAIAEPIKIVTGTVIDDSPQFTGSFSLNITEDEFRKPTTFTFNDGGNSYVFTAADEGDDFGEPGFHEYDFQNSNGDQFGLLVESSNGNTADLCSVAHECFEGQTQVFSFVAPNGSDDINFLGGELMINSTPAVPEPSSIALLGTGALSMAGMVRRRFTHR